jgi:hypothetical protein
MRGIVFEMRGNIRNTIQGSHDAGTVADKKHRGGRRQKMSFVYRRDVEDDDKLSIDNEIQDTLFRFS